MATKTFGAEPNTKNEHTVTARSTTTTLTGSDIVNVVINDAKSWDEVTQALRALMRHLSYQQSQMTAPSSLPTSGTRVE